MIEVYSCYQPSHDCVQTRGKERYGTSLKVKYHSSILLENLESSRRLTKVWHFGITDSREASRFIIEARDCESEFVALDSETIRTLYPRDGHMIGISLSYDGDTGVPI